MASLTKIALEKFVNEFELENMTPFLTILTIHEYK